MKNKKGFEFGFGWIFAMIAGAIIIFLAIYAASNLAKQEKIFTESSTAREFGILTSSFETSLEEDKPDSIIFPVKTEIFSGCSSDGTFGKQKISTARRSELGGGEVGVNSSFSNRYFFSKKNIAGKKFIVWSKPVNIPFKAADALYIWPAEEKYCFIDPPEKLESNLRILISNNELLNNTIILATAFDKGEKCKDANNKVCFGSSSGCNINVLANKVKKDGKEAYYEFLNDDYSLLYGAIFSDLDIYECQLKRIMKRATNLALIYKSKSEMLGAKGCGLALESELESYAQFTAGFNKSSELIQFESIAQQLEEKNDALSCPLF